MSKTKARYSMANHAGFKANRRNFDVHPQDPSEGKWMNLIGWAAAGPVALTSTGLLENHQFNQNGRILKIQPNQLTRKAPAS
jgi:hypothetical protein